MPVQSDTNADREGMSVPRRIVTGHDASGKSVVLSDAPSPRTLDIGIAAFHEIWITAQMPVQIDASEPESTDRPVRVPPPAGGVSIRFIDTAPGAESPMHRTETVDLGVVLEGEIWMLLDDGSETRVGVGDAVIQRGTNHAWANRSDRPVRMLFVLIDGEISDELRASAGQLEFFDQVLDEA
jgi:quercetin dioxygenase-like cupin family protein